MKGINGGIIMFCQKCGATITEGKKFCGVCGASVEEKSETEYSTPSSVNQNYNSSNNTIKVIYVLLAITVIIIFFLAANSVVKGGNEIMKIESVGGRTLEEAYYQELGKVYSGFAMAIRGFGIFAAGVLLKLGFK